MATVSHESPTVAERRPSWMELEVVWASLAISVMWLAVLFDGVFGPDIRVINGANSTTIPSAVGVALFAFLATAGIAKRSFGQRR